MAKPFKILLFSVAGLIVLLVAALIAAAALFDPNDYRDQIAAAVKEETGRELTLGEIQLKIFPWLRVAIFDAELNNAQGFGDEPFATLKELSVGVKLLPLLIDKNVEISAVTLDGLHLNIAKDAEGRGNWQDILDVQASKPEDTSPKIEGEATFELNNIDVSGVTIRDAALKFTDAQNKAEYKVRNLNLTTGSLRPGDPFDIDASLTASASAPAVEGDLTLSGTVTHTADILNVQNLELGVKGQGFDMALQALVTAGLTADLKKQTYTLSGLTMAADASGKALPGGQQKLQLTGALTYDGDKGAMRLEDAELKAAGVTLRTAISGSGLNTDTPRLSGPISISAFNPRELLAKLDMPMQTADKDALKEASLKAQYSGTFSSAKLDELTLKLDQTTATGKVHLTDFSTQAVEFSLKVDEINADRYLPPETEAAGTKAESTGDINEIKLPTEALEKLNANGTLDIGKLTLNGIKLSDVRVKLSGSGPAAAKQQQLTAQLYGGKVNLSNRIAPGTTPAFALKTELTALNFAPFLKDLADKDMVSGMGNLSLDLNSRGQTVGALRQALNGTVNLRIEDGAVKGFNLGEILRRGQAALAGNLNYSESGAPKETDFAAISVSAQIVNGILKSDDLSASSPAFRLAGAGEINLVDETINYLAKPTVVETSGGQGGKGLEDLRGLTIPIKLSGSLYAPKYKLDIESALKQKATEKIREEFKGKEEELKNKLNDKLGDLLFGRQKKAPPPAEPATEAPAASPGT